MDVTINFVFANYEKKVIVSTNTRATGGDLKNLLYSNWPDGIPICEDRNRVRLICMGRGFLADDAELGPKFPKFDHPTPINVSIRPAAAGSAGASTQLRAASATASPSSNPNAASRYQQQPQIQTQSPVGQPASAVSSSPPNGQRYAVPQTGQSQLNPRAVRYDVNQNQSTSPTPESHGRCCTIS